jgi:hypothetical protein
MSQQIKQSSFLVPSVGTLKTYEEDFRKFFAAELKSSSLFLMLLDMNDANAVKRSGEMCAQIVSRLGAEVQRIPLVNLGWVAGISEALVIERSVIKNMSPDSIRREIEDIIRLHVKEKTTPGGRVRLTQHGLFIPRKGSISVRSFAHGHGHYYRYRLATFKIDTVPESFRDFLLTLPSTCPDEYFLSGPRGSSFDMEFTIKLESSIVHPLVRFARDGLRIRKLKSAHEDLEKYLLESDPETIACEVPIWLEPHELQQLAFVDSGEGTLTGHIDVLRFERGNKIAIWDYKPSAQNETKAHIQVYLYALMLSKRTGLPLEYFNCGYFDSTIAFFFNPAEIGWSPNLCSDL